jgi:hypothetical protein
MCSSCNEADGSAAAALTLKVPKNEGTPVGEVHLGAAVFNFAGSAADEAFGANPAEEEPGKGFEVEDSCFSSAAERLLPEAANSCATYTMSSSGSRPLNYKGHQKEPGQCIFKTAVPFIINA